MRQFAVDVLPTVGGFVAVALVVGWVAFGDMLKEFSKRSQFIVVTHNRATMEAAEILYGVTLAEDGSSKVVSLKLES